MSTKSETQTKSESKDELSVIPTNGAGTQIAKASDARPKFPYVDLDSAKELPDLEQAEIVPLELTSEYWTPTVEGETKRLVFSHIEDQLMPARNNPEENIMVPTAFFYEKKDGSIATVRQASKLLLAALQNNAVRRGTPLIITWTGKVKVKNGNMADSWSVKPLLLKEEVKS